MSIRNCECINAVEKVKVYNREKNDSLKNVGMP